MYAWCSSMRHVTYEDFTVNTFFHYISFTCERLLVPAWYVCVCVDSSCLYCYYYAWHTVAVLLAASIEHYSHFWTFFVHYFLVKISQFLARPSEIIRKNNSSFAISLLKVNKNAVSYSYFLLGDTWNWDLSSIILRQKILNAAIV